MMIGLGIYQTFILDFSRPMCLTIALLHNHMNRCIVLAYLKLRTHYHDLASILRLELNYIFVTLIGLPAILLD